MTDPGMERRMPDATRSLKLVEINLFVFAFLINFVWEVLQTPLFSYPSNASLVQINLACLRASVGDAAMILVAFWIVAILQKGRGWIFHLSWMSLALFLLPGIVMTIVFEALATGPLQRWTYAAAMPVLPGLGTGIAPLAQWLILPPIVAFIVNRQLRPSH
ncbi:MAG: hypothetical protein ABIP56_00910 [Dokdonella sp.]